MGSQARIASDYGNFAVPVSRRPPLPPNGLSRGTCIVSLPVMIFSAPAPYRSASLAGYNRKHCLGLKIVHGTCLPKAALLDEVH
jgi:hypothetical protein